MKPWTTREIEKLRKLFGEATYAAIGQGLNRSEKAVQQKAHGLGLRMHVKADFGERFIAMLREKNTDGWSDSEIAERWGCDRHVVSRKRRELGLPSNQRSARVRRKLGDAMRAQCREAGVRNLAELKTVVLRCRQHAHGWPPELRTREIEILNALADGPKTRRELCAAIGLPWLGPRKSLKCTRPGGSWLAYLMRLGFVGKHRIRRKGHGKGHAGCRYSLTEHAQRRTVINPKFAHVEAA